MNPGRQLPLPVGLRDGSTLTNFLPAVNGEALLATRALVEGRERFVYLWGAPDTGRTHLLEAAIEAMAANGRSVAYLALRNARDGDGRRTLTPDVLDGIDETANLVCLDDLEGIAGDRAWEEALFNLFNTLRSRGSSLLVAASASPAGVGIALPDLASRLGSGLTIRLHALPNDEREAVLVFRAKQRGLEIAAETAQYLLAHCSRRLADLVLLLDELDAAALAGKRRLTLPFVRDWLRRGTDIATDGRGDVRGVDNSLP